jgi:hypothetical protein
MWLAGIFDFWNYYSPRHLAFNWCQIHSRKPETMKCAAAVITFKRVCLESKRGVCPIPHPPSRKIWQMMGWTEKVNSNIDSIISTLELTNHVFSINWRILLLAKYHFIWSVLTIRAVRLVVTNYLRWTALCFILKAQLWRHSLFLYFIS